MFWAPSSFQLSLSSLFSLMPQTELCCHEIPLSHSSSSQGQSFFGPPKVTSASLLPCSLLPGEARKPCALGCASLGPALGTGDTHLSSALSPPGH